MESPENSRDVRKKSCTNWDGKKPAVNTGINYLSTGSF